MSTEPVPTPPPVIHVPATPPTRPGTRDDGKGPIVWPVVLGVAGLILGIGGMLTAVLGLLMPKFGNTVAGTGVPVRPMMGYFGPLSGAFTIYYVCTLALASMLAIASYRMLRTRPSAPAWMVIWAILKLVHAAFAVWFTLEYMAMATEGQQSIWATSSSRPPPQAVVATINVVLAWVVGILTAAWSIWAPLFLLWWFRRSKVRTQWAARCTSVQRQTA